jgi:diguanylate cyclase (GGDEF)-like protein
LLACLCVLAWGLAPSAASASESLAELLDQADAVRSTDPARFQQLLQQAEPALPTATAPERDLYEYLRAYELAYTGRFDLAIDSAKRIFEKGANTELRFRAGAFLVNNFAATREFTEGLRYLNLTMALVDLVDDRDVRHHGMLSAALLYNQLGEEELGQTYAERILADAPNPRNRCYAAHLRSESMLALGSLPDGDAELERVVADCSAVGEPVGANLVRMHLARRWSRIDERARAIELLERHLAEVERTAYPRLIGEYHSLLAELRLADGDPALAEKHALIAVRHSAGIENSQPLVAAYRVMYEVARQRGDDAEALNHYRHYAEADKAYLDDVKARELALQLVRHETLQKNQTIELLNNQNRVLNLEQQVARQDARNTQLLVALLAVLLAFIGYWAWKTKKMQVSFRKLAETDTLTGVSNRHHFSRRAEEVLEQCRRSGEAAALVMFDLDQFKSINDRYGHAVGDWVLIRVAAACRDAGRRGDLFGRLGGEEFAFVMPATGAEAGVKLAQECRARLAAIDTAPTGHSFGITASFGVADTTAGGHDFHPLMARADAAMYRAKRDGRDRVQLAVDAAEPALS